MIRFSMLTDLGNYLRVRGEYSMTVTDQFAQAELPPRTRRILGVLDARFKSRGTTSAYAENTQTTPPPPPRWNYLRVRGEYTWSPNCFLYTKELPPRTRRIPLTILPRDNKNGTTSAYAENTALKAVSSAIIWNYLRVRGEYVEKPVKIGQNRELPPRTRRIHQQSDSITDPIGTTSAYAENTVCLAT